jgi:hypothetical protein
VNLKAAFDLQFTIKNLQLKIKRASARVSLQISLFDWAVPADFPAVRS